MAVETSSAVLSWDANILSICSLKHASNEKRWSGGLSTAECGVSADKTVSSAYKWTFAFMGDRGEDPETPLSS